MAERTLIVRVIGDDRSLKQAFARDEKAVTAFGASSTKSLGKVNDAFTRTQKIAAGGFIGGAILATAITGLRSVIGAASNAQQVLGQTKVALESTGKSWAVYGKQIEDAVAKQSRLGFDDEELLKTFALFVRTTKDVNKALEDNALAMDVARARHIDLASAANLVNKANLGMAGSLRRLGIDVQNGASSQELLTRLTESYGGAAESASKDATTGFDRLKVSFENVQEAIGSGLLPTLSKMAGAIADTTDEVSTLIGKLGELGDIKVPAIHIPLVPDFGGGGGGTAGTIGRTLLRGGENFPGFGPILKAVELQVNASAERGKQAAKLAAAKQTTKLANDFGDSLNSMFTNALNGAAAKVKPDTAGVKGFGSGLKPEDLFGPLVTDISSKLQEALLNVEIKTPDDHGAIVAQLEKQRDALTNALDDPRLTRKQRINIKEKLKGIIGDIDAENAQIQQAVDDASRKRLAGIEAATQKAQQAKEKERQKLAKLQEALQARVQAKQFKAIGLGATGGDLVPGVDNLQKQLAQLTDRLGPDISSKLAGKLAGVGKVLSGQFGKITEDSRQAINELFKTIRGTFDQESRKATKAISVNKSVQLSDKILNALGFDKNLDVSRLKNVLPSSLGPSSVTPVRAATATTQAGVTISGPITVVADNPDAFLRELQKKAGRTSATARGRFPGRNLGLG